MKWWIRLYKVQPLNVDNYFSWSNQMEQFYVETIFGIMVSPVTSAASENSIATNGSEACKRDLALGILMMSIDSFC